MTTPSLIHFPIIWDTSSAGFGYVHPMFRFHDTFKTTGAYYRWLARLPEREKRRRAANVANPNPPCNS